MARPMPNWLMPEPAIIEPAISVSTPPGQTALQRMPELAYM